MSVTDDDVIRRRLLIDGDGGLDDKRINNLLKSYIKWCNSSETDEENDATYQRLMSTVAQCEFTMEKSLLVYEMNLREQANYGKLNRQIEEKITQAMDKIAECKNELIEAKTIRRNRQEYDNLAAVIQKQPDRQTSMKKLQELEDGLTQLKTTKEKLEQKLDLRRKQFHVLLSSIHELQRILEDDNADESDMETS
ncbi:THO complex subunit 7 homolog isoform X2 [Liolophura sinensis]|uniref:THO complex subunit 7 homolog isoform X2 n=1 Tax=Liolophura sinensis TaxID=3198878 RepID=UPI003158B8F0